MRNRVLGLETEMLASYLSFIEEAELISQQTKVFEMEDMFISFLREKFGEFFSNDFIQRVILPNQSQVYLDTGNKFLEICTPECSSVKDLVLHKRVGDVIVARDLRRFNKQLQENNCKPDVGLYFHHMATDNKRKGTCGCHENYQIYQMEKDIKYPPRELDKGEGWPVVSRVLSPFLVARKLLEGSGLIFESFFGGHPFLSFCISQRMEFIKRMWGPHSSSEQERPAILTRDEPLTVVSTADSFMKEEVKNFKRCQILIGEQNWSPFCDFIKFGSVSLLFEMIEEGYFVDKERNIPWFSSIVYSTGFFLNRDFFKKVNRDIECQELFFCCHYAGSVQYQKGLKLHEILDIYSDWMFDYLSSYGSGEKDHLYLEKLEVARKIKYAADCFSGGDIFALDEEIDWIIKLRWLQDLIKTETGIEIDDKEFISGAANLTDL
ncbi:proteasome accessory factor PafA2 family protein, partial [Patescibacteria group bacterium]|nr:proteasome accessory factor PafA2 family protein [Patescibacteria group bacterium]